VTVAARTEKSTALMAAESHCRSEPGSLTPPARNEKSVKC
jgi:hypothetical protein